MILMGEKDVCTTLKIASKGVNGDEFNGYKRT